MKYILCILLAILMCFPAAAKGDITVGAGKDYRSFTQAVYETYDSCEDIVVYPGEYDIRSEYQCFFGIDDINDTMDLGNNFQYGVRLRDRKVTFLPGARLVCVWGLPPDYTARFSP